MTLALEGGNSAHDSGKTSKAITVSTSGTDRIIVVCAGNEGNASLRQISSVAATGLTFALRAKQTQAAGTPTFGNEAEIWWAYAASQQTNTSITVTWDGATDDLGVGVFAVSGCQNFVNPWDTGSAITVAHTGAAGAVDQTNVGTTHTNTLQFWYGGVPTSGYPLSAAVTPAGSSECFSPIIETGGSNYYKANSAYAIYSVAQSGLTVGWTTSLAPWVLLIDALTDAPASAGLSIPVAMNSYRQHRNRRGPVPPRDSWIRRNGIYIPKE
jgi:hypothetical protein